MSRRPSVLNLGLMVFALHAAGLPSYPATYEVSVTREDSNLYKVDGKDIVIKTRYCYEYAYSEDSILRTNGSNSKLVFLDAGESCDVEAVFGGVALSAGKYSVTVSREDDNLYSVAGSETFIKTSLCLSLALSEDALLRMTYGGRGTLYFIDDSDSCDVEGVFKKLKL